MQHLKSNPVQELRRILKDQYSFSSIVKELIQNADDAGATQFHLGWVPEWPSNTHPLLTGPTMLCLNNGDFRPADAKAIWHLDEGAKGGDVGTIGKYGLGMKSVFHLCEGFFYAASEDQPAANGRPFVELLNPWPEKGPHDNWNNMSAATSSIIDRISSWSHGSTRWFSLIIPLRTPGHLNGAEAIIPGQFPHIRELLDSYQSHELATLTTLLRSLQSITIWSWNKDRQNLAVETQLSLDPVDCSRRAFPNIKRGESRSIRMQVIAPGSLTKSILRASGIETLSDAEKFRTIKRDKRWPKNATLNPETGRSEDMLEKAEPHCAAVFTETDAPTGNLRVRIAVFLPLAKGDSESLECRGEKHIELILHGQFFLDAGRRELYQNDGSQGSLQEEWNDLLLNKGVLSLICPALDEYVRVWSVPDDDVANLTDALAHSKLLYESRQHICASVNWVKRVEFTPEGSRWCLQNSMSPYFEIPELDGRSDKAVGLLPGLVALSEEIILVEQGRPRLALNDSTPWHLEEAHLRALLSGLDAQHLNDKGALTFAAEFFRPLKESMPVSAFPVLVSKLRDGIARHGIRAIQAVADAFTSLTAAAPTNSWVKIGPLEKDAASIYRDLNSLQLNHVLLPPDLCPSDAIGDQLSTGESRSVFQWLEESRDRRSIERTANVALHVLQVTTAAREEQREILGDHKVFLARTGDDETPGSVLSWNTLIELLSEGRLFAGRSPLLTSLQKSLHDVQVYSLYGPSGIAGFQLLFGQDQATNCDANACLRFLTQSQPLLAAPSGRSDLLKHLVASLNQDTSSEDIATVRYLLHGNKAHFRDTDIPLLIPPSTPQGEHWGRIVQHALNKLGSEWRWIPGELWRILTPDQQELLSIEQINVNTVEKLLVQAGADWLTNLGLSEPERMSLLIDIGSRNVWRSLPLHERVDGTQIAISNRAVYLQPDSDTSIPPQMLLSIDVLAVPKSELLVQKYRGQGIRFWSAETAIEVALAAEDPSQLAVEILDALEWFRSTATNLQPALRERLQNTAWLPKSDKSAVAPCDVVVLSDLDAYLERLLAEPEVAHAFTCVADLAPAARSHIAFGLLGQRHILPDVKLSLRILAECLGAVPKYRIGILQGINSDGAALDLICKSFIYAGPDCLPALSFLKALATAFPDQTAMLSPIVLDPLRKELPITTLQKCVRVLADVAHEHSQRYNRKAIGLLQAYLGDLLRHPGYQHEALAGITLPSRAGHLQCVEALCVRAEGIDTSHLLADDLCNLFNIQRESTAPEDEIVEAVLDPEASSALLLHYMRGWEGLVSKPLRGGLLALFGDSTSIHREAADLLRPRSVKGFRGEIEWPQYDHSKMTGANEDVH